MVGSEGGIGAKSVGTRPTSSMLVSMMCCGLWETDRLGKMDGWMFGWLDVVIYVKRRRGIVTFCKRSVVCLFACVVRRLSLVACRLSFVVRRSSFVLRGSAMRFKERKESIYPSVIEYLKEM